MLCVVVIVSQIAVTFHCLKSVHFGTRLEAALGPDQLGRSKRYSWVSGAGHEGVGKNERKGKRQRTNMSGKENWGSGMEGGVESGCRLI